MATHAVPGTGLELILNAAEGVLQIVVTEDEAILCAQEWYRSERATEILAPALAELATSLGIRWSDLRRIACVRGPGSFTGIRLTLATAAALRRCGRAQLAGLDRLSRQCPRHKDREVFVSPYSFAARAERADRNLI